MPDQNGVLDGIVSEVQLPQTDSAKPKKSVGEQESSSCSTDKRAKDAQRGTTTNTAGTGAASSSSATPVQTQATGESGLAELNHKIDKLTSTMNNVTPVVKELKTAYDAARKADDMLLQSDYEDEESATADENVEPPAKKGKSVASEIPTSVLVADLV